MTDYVRILSEIADWNIYQQVNGYYQLELQGDYEPIERGDYPVIKIVDTFSEEVVRYDRLPCVGRRWEYRINLKSGIYRLETGLSLAATGHNPLYLGRGKVIRNLFIGEIFVIAGQSNATGYGQGPVKDSPTYGVLMYNNGWKLACHPIGYMDEETANVDNLISGHSPWLNLGKLILENHNLPVGLVPVSLNGSGIDMWTENGSLYRNMIAKARKTGARHLIWYQGCTDANNNEVQGYEQKLDGVLGAIKRDIGHVDIYLVQISGTTSDLVSGQSWRVVREAQRRMAVKHGTYLIPTYDLTSYTDDIHLGPPDNIRLSQRVYERYRCKIKAQPISIRKTVRCIKITFHEIKAIGSVELLCLDSLKRPVPVELTAEGNTVTLRGTAINQVRFITLPFDRLYQGKTIKDMQGNCISYFYFDLESD